MNCIPEFSSLNDIQELKNNMLIDNETNYDDGNEASGGNFLKGNQGKNSGIRDASDIMQSSQLPVQASRVNLIFHFLTSNILWVHLLARLTKV